MSSLSNKLVTVVVPLANAANNNARFDKLFEPGKLISPSIREIGSKVIAFITRPPFYFYTQIYDHVRQDQAHGLILFFPHHGLHASWHRQSKCDPH